MTDWNSCANPPTRHDFIGAYEEFIASKQLADVPSGFDCDVPVGPLFDFQAVCVKWALKMGRRGVGSELKPSYFKLAAENCKSAVLDQVDLFAEVAA